VESTANEPCELLPWDTEFFGVRIARAHGDVLTPRIASGIDEWCAAQKIDCLYFLARSDDPETVKLAESRGYHLADVRITFETANMDRQSVEGCAVRASRADDLAELKRIARSSHTDTRFFFDDHFPRHRAEALYEAWIQFSMEGFAEAVLVSDEGGHPTGYVTCHLPVGSDKGSIGLIAVDGAHHNRGVGRALVDSAVEWFSKRGTKRVSVVTQGRNLAAQRLYTRCGFLPRRLDLYYHRWFADGGSAAGSTDKDRR
jgi:ribosomal protein S18 acetylase RimI-like enzyme